MKPINRKILFFLFLGLFFLPLWPNPKIGQIINFASALEVKLPGLVDNPNLGEYISYIFNSILQIAGVLAVLAIVFGGVYHLVSLGRGKITDEGKEWVKSGVFGLVLLMSSYLILYTINPNLISIRQGSLLPISLPTINISTPEESNVPTITFNEIPIGTLTENLLARTMDCYDFDQNGDPIDGDPSTPDILEPTYYNHDRIDCFLKLGEAVEKTAKVISDLSAKIAGPDFMDSCNCTETTCSLNCSGVCAWQGGCSYPRPTGSCGDCTDIFSCKNLGDNDSCCSPDVKQQIEQGPITLERADCIGGGKTYDGLDEFRSQFPNNDELLSVVETKIPNTETIIINKSAWIDLRLIDKLKYFKEKIKQINLDTDLTNLKNAEGKMGECYLSKSYKDFLKLMEETLKDNATIQLVKIFKDPVTTEDIDASRYCKGFGYENASIFNVCQKICLPGANEISLDALKNCPTGSGCSDEEIKSDFYKCAPNNYGFQSFQQCLTEKTNQCKDICQIKYVNCPDSLQEQECEDACDKDSKALIQKDDCYLDPQVIQNCATAYSNIEDFERCTGNSMCRYCTDQYASYPDCFNNAVNDSDTYSSLFFYQNPNLQKAKTNNPETTKCPNCSNCPDCPRISATRIDENLLTCSGDCGEFAYKDDPLTFYCRIDWWEEAYQNTSSGPQLPSGMEGLTAEDRQMIESEEGLTEEEKNELLQGEEIKTTVLAKAISCPREDEIPVGQTVDQAEAWAQALADLINQFVGKTEDMITYIKGIGDETGYCQCNSVCGGSETTCGGECSRLTHCIDPYSYWTTCYDGDGNPYPCQIYVPGYCNCSCNFVPCLGNSCQKMINLFQGKAANAKCPAGTAYKGVDAFYQEIKTAFDAFSESTIQQRSDILKMLSYSRKETNICGETSSIFKGETRFLNCTYIEDYNIDPISGWKTTVNGEIFKGYCYGNQVGKISNINADLMDNWSCCRETIK
jgi:hypothetical protein